MLQVAPQAVEYIPPIFFLEQDGNLTDSFGKFEEQGYGFFGCAWMRHDIHHVGHPDIFVEVECGELSWSAGGFGKHGW